MFSIAEYMSVRCLYVDFIEVQRTLPEVDLGFPIWKEKISRLEDKAIKDWNDYSEAVSALLKFLEDARALYICTPSASILKVDRSILSRELAGNNSGFTGMWAINHESWCIDLSRAEAWIDGTEGRLDILRKKMSLRKANNLNVDDLQRDINSYWTARQRATLITNSFRPFAGSSLCIREEDAPSRMDIINLLRTGGMIDQEAKTGRPSLQEQVRTAYVLRFPGGHAGVTWKMVQSEIQNECGILPSVDTIRRALGLRQ